MILSNIFRRHKKIVDIAINTPLDVSNQEEQVKPPKKIHMPDELQMYFGADFVINDYITVKQPTIGEIIDYGEQAYYSMVGTLCAIPFDFKLLLWEELQINYMDMTEFELFCMMSKRFTSKETGIIFGDLDLSKFEIMVDMEQEIQEGEKPNIILVHQDNDKCVIDESVYTLIVTYLRQLHNINPYKNFRKAGNKTTFNYFMEMDKEEREKNKDKPYVSQMKNLVSTMLVYAGFKYKKNELRDCGLYEFMDAVQRAQIFVSTDALYKGMYSGMVDLSGVDKNEFNWFRDISYK